MFANARPDCAMKPAHGFDVGMIFEIAAEGDAILLLDIGRRDFGLGCCPPFRDDFLLGDLLRGWRVRHGNGNGDDELAQNLPKKALLVSADA